ncbi:MAG: hypothetical protein A3I12_06555 [Gammaproteobacteria bacterium RIFCSPLOWO2_02_FULL_38_11]|nr:MAG: hypothetical protein A3B69_02990 [Gammaproteobacteria bacterium RIFCSPHIGHO2_02_FULL_38_33]OGT23696.1 MAG: hypothetical protein A2W47_02030 [Gammaproteobacteria bacterium RIFCSPHIGHO2_12_38_15]OGT68728.1 MAG: hypothetical protein A3I12_06555 [Gammaproteobacteria bacterium RIFCSPLOWO2_02_FULL_38_11]
MPEQSPNVAKKKFNICISLLLITFLLQIASNCLTPIWAIYTNMIGGDVRSAGISILIFTWGTALFAIISPVVTRKIKISDFSLLILGIFIDFIAILFYFFVHDIYLFYFLQIFLALGAGIQIPPFYSIYAQHILNFKNKNFAWGALDAVLYFAIGLGSLISSQLLFHHNIYHVFFFMLILTFLAFILAVFTRSTKFY